MAKEPISPNSRNEANRDQRRSLLYPSFKDIFPRVPATNATLSTTLKELSRTDTIFHCSRLNHVAATHEPHYEIQIRLLAFIRPSAPARRKLNKFAEKYRIANCNPIFRGQLLELVSRAALESQDWVNDGKTFESDERGNWLLRALLLAAESWGNRVVPKHRLEAAAVKMESRLPALRYAYSENAVAPHIFTTLSRGLWILRKIESEEPNFPVDFARSTGLDLETFLRIALALNWRYVDHTELQPEGEEKNTGVFSEATLIQNTPRKAEAAQFLKETVQKIDDFALALRRADKSIPIARHLRDQPILKANDGRMIICDPVAFRDTMFKSPIFRVERSKRKRYIDAYSHAIEAYAQAWLAELFRAPVFQLTPNLKLRENGKDVTEIDALVRQGNIAILFEVKAGNLCDQYMLENAEDKFLDDFNAKIGFAATQFAEASRYIGSDAVKSVPELVGSSMLLPVVVVADELLDPNVESYIDSRLRSTLNADDSNSWIAIGTVRVARVTLIPISLLEKIGRIPRGAMPGRSDHDRAWVRGDHVGWANEARTKSSQRPVLS